MKNLTLLIALIAFPLCIRAQATPTFKIAYANTEYIFSQLPEAKQIEVEVKATTTQLENQVKAKQQDLQKKYADYMANEKNMLEAVKVNTQRELNQLNENIQRFQQDAQTTLENKQAQLLQPVQKKIGDAIAAVAKEEGIALVLSPDAGLQNIILYGDQSLDISNKILLKLGVTPKPIPTK